MEGDMGNKQTLDGKISPAIIKENGEILPIKDTIQIKAGEIHLLIKVGVTNLKIKVGGIKAWGVNPAVTRVGVNIHNRIRVDGEPNSQIIKKTGAALVDGD